MVSAKFDNRVALVTGAGGLIGSATCRMLAEAGVKVAVTDLTAEVTARVVDPLRERGLEARGYGLDLMSSSGVRSAVSAIERDYGKIDILVNNAGVWDHGGSRDRQAFETIPEEQWVRLLRLNVEGTLRVTQAVLPGMYARGYGRIINLGSIAGVVGLPGACDYSASKGAISLLTRALAMEAAGRGVTVNAVSPGWVEKDVRAIPGTWIGRTGLPEEMARAILFFADDDAGFTTGTELPVDGGRVLGPHGEIRFDPEKAFRGSEVHFVRPQGPADC